MESEDVLGNTRKMGKVLHSLHKEMKEKHPSVGDVRSIGLFGCLELVKNRKTKEPMPADVILKLNTYLKQQRTLLTIFPSLLPQIIFW